MSEKQRRAFPQSQEVSRKRQPRSAIRHSSNAVNLKQRKSNGSLMSGEALAREGHPLNGSCRDAKDLSQSLDEGMVRHQNKAKRILNSKPKEGDKLVPPSKTPVISPRTSNASFVCEDQGLKIQQSVEFHGRDITIQEQLSCSTKSKRKTWNLGGQLQNGQAAVAKSPDELSSPLYNALFDQDDSSEVGENPSPLAHLSSQNNNRAAKFTVQQLSIKMQAATVEEASQNIIVNPQCSSSFSNKMESVDSPTGRGPPANLEEAFDQKQKNSPEANAFLGKKQIELSIPGLSVTSSQQPDRQKLGLFQSLLCCCSGAPQRNYIQSNTLRSPTVEKSQDASNLQISFQHRGPDKNGFFFNASNPSHVIEEEEYEPPQAFRMTQKNVCVAQAFVAAQSKAGDDLIEDSEKLLDEFLEQHLRPNMQRATPSGGQRGAHDPSDIVQGADMCSSDSIDDDDVLAQVDEREAHGYAALKAERKQQRRGHPKDVGDEFENTVIPDEIDSRFDVVLEQQHVADSRNEPRDGVLHMVESASLSNDLGTSNLGSKPEISQGLGSDQDIKNAVSQVVPRHQLHQISEVNEDNESAFSRKQFSISSGHRLQAAALKLEHVQSGLSHNALSAGKQEEIKDEDEESGFDEDDDETAAQGLQPIDALKMKLKKTGSHMKVVQDNQHGQSKGVVEFQIEGPLLRKKKTEDLEDESSKQYKLFLGSYENHHTIDAFSIQNLIPEEESVEVLNNEVKTLPQVSIVEEDEEEVGYQVQEVSQHGNTTQQKSERQEGSASLSSIQVVKSQKNSSIQESPEAPFTEGRGSLPPPLKAGGTDSLSLIVDQFGKSTNDNRSQAGRSSKTGGTSEQTLSLAKKNLNPKLKLLLQMEEERKREQVVQQVDSFNEAARKTRTNFQQRPSTIGPNRQGWKKPPQGANLLKEDELAGIQKCCSKSPLLDRKALRNLARKQPGLFLGLWAFGLNKNNELGIKQKSSAKGDGLNYTLLPSPVEFEPFKEAASSLFSTSSRLPIKQIASGEEHTGIVTDDGRLFMAGSFLMDKLAFPPPQNLNYAKQKKFKEVVFGVHKRSTLQNPKVAQFACGDRHSVCLTYNHEVYTWGGTLKGKRGDDPDKRPTKSGLNSLGESQESSLGSSQVLFYVPNIINALKGKKIVQVACGSTHSMALDAEGIVYSWGDQTYDQCGHDFKTFSHKLKNNEVTDHKYLKPRPIEWFVKNGISISQISCGSQHSLAVAHHDDDGRLVSSLYSWGYNHRGQCGITNKDTVSVPMRVAISDNCKHKNNALALNRSDGDLRNTHARGGLEEMKACHSEQRQNEGSCCCAQILQVSSGDSHTLVLMSDQKTLWTFGNNSSGQLGREVRDKMASNQKKPGKVDLTSSIFSDLEEGSDTKIESIAAGKFHSLLLTTQGAVFGCGKTNVGELGLGGGDDPDLDDDDFTFSQPKVLEKGIPHFVPLYSASQVRVSSVFAGGQHSFLVINEKLLK